MTPKAKAVAGGTSILQARDGDFLQLLQWDFMGPGTGRKMSGKTNLVSLGFPSLL